MVFSFSYALFSRCDYIFINCEITTSSIWCIVVVLATNYTVLRSSGPSRSVSKVQIGEFSILGISYCCRRRGCDLVGTLSKGRQPSYGISFQNYQHKGRLYACTEPPLGRGFTG